MKSGTSVCVGEEILSALPFVQIVNSNNKGQYCDNCFKRVEHVRKCTACRTDGYCCVQCQRTDWHLTHKIECPKLKMIQPHCLPDALRLLAKLSLRLSTGGDDVTEAIENDYRRKFSDLVTHVEEISSCPSVMEEFSELRAYLLKYLGPDWLPNNLFSIFGAMVTNSFSVTDEQQKVIGSALYLAGSIFDHSCRPNAVVTFQGTKLTVRAVEDIQDFRWNKVHINYIEIMDTRSIRRQSLKSQYRFDCCCRRCEDPSTAALENSLRCGNPSCSSSVPVFPEESCSGDVTLTCPQCGFGDYSASTVSEYKAMVACCTGLFEEKLKLDQRLSLDDCKTLLQSQQDLGSGTGSTHCMSLAVVGGDSGTKLPPSVLSCYAKSAAANGCLLHPLNVWRVKVLDAAFEAAIDAELFADALELGLLNVEGMKHYNGKYHPAFCYFLAKLGKMSLYCDRLDEALTLLARAVDGLSISYGHGHTVTVTVRGILEETLREHTMYGSEL